VPLCTRCHEGLCQGLLLSWAGASALAHNVTATFGGNTRDVIGQVIPRGVADEGALCHTYQAWRRSCTIPSLAATGT
jgi:hypothetical protein